MKGINRTGAPLVHVPGWMDGWMGGSKSRFKDCLQQSKNTFFVLSYTKVNWYVWEKKMLTNKFEYCFYLVEASQPIEN